MVMEYEGGMEIKMLLEREEDSEIGVRKREILKKEEEWEEDREILSECEWKIEEEWRDVRVLVMNILQREGEVIERVSSGGRKWQLVGGSHGQNP